MTYIAFAVYTNTVNYPPVQHILKLQNGESPPIVLPHMHEFIYDFMFFTYDIDDIVEYDMHYLRYILLNQNATYPYNIIEFIEPFLNTVYFENSKRLLVPKAREPGARVLRMFKAKGCCNYLNSNIFLTINEKAPPKNCNWVEMYESPLFVF